MITRGYCTLAEFQARVGKTDASITAKTTLIERSIERASRRIDLETDSFFYQSSVTDSKVVHMFNVNSDGFVMSEDARFISCKAPIISISKIVNNETELVEGEDYYIQGNVIIANTIFTTNRKNGVQITGVVGYASTPDDINDCCRAMVEVMTGMGIRTVLDPAGDKLEITRDVIPDWVWEKLAMRRRYIACG